jgi:gas vesicle protein
MDTISSAVGVIVGIIGILGAIGSVAVLFYRVRTLEQAQQRMDDRIKKSEELLHEVSTQLATIQADLRWIRQALDPAAQTGAGVGH